MNSETGIVWSPYCKVTPFDPWWKNGSYLFGHHKVESIIVTKQPTIPSTLRHLVMPCNKIPYIRLLIINASICNTGQGKETHIKYKRLKLCGGQTYYCSSD